MRFAPRRPRRRHKPPPPEARSLHDPAVPSHWARVLGRMIARGHRRRALRYLDWLIEGTLPLFKTDPMLLRERRLALRLKIQLLREWRWYAEALAWACLDSELNPGDGEAGVMKEWLMKTIKLTGDGSGQGPDPAVTASNAWPGVAGMHELKAILERDVIMPMLNPDLYKQYGLSLPNGILLYGPPGCGKTFIARKLAGRLGFNFREVRASDIASIYVHGTQGLIGQTFRQAREQAPTLLFFDELDAFIPRRGDSGVFYHYAAEVNEFLAQLNNAWSARVLVVGATNMPEKIDEAARRPGRLDKKIFVGPPDLEARVELFRLYLEGRPQKDIDLVACAWLSENYTCAEVKLLVDEAARIALAGKRPIEGADIIQATMSVRPQLTPEDIEKYRTMAEE